jgi:hypothetical protein
MIEDHVAAAECDQRMLVGVQCFRFYHRCFGLRSSLPHGLASHRVIGRMNQS